MDLVGIENISPYQGVYEFKIYKYEYELNLNRTEGFICDLKVIINKIEPMYEGRIDKNKEVLGLVKNLSVKSNKMSIIEDIKEFILNEVYEENLEKKNIEIMFIES